MGLIFWVAAPILGTVWLGSGLGQRPKQRKSWGAEMRAEFSERWYEFCLNYCLCKGSKMVPFIPSQVEEKYLGFDAAHHIKHPEFWKRIPGVLPWPWYHSSLLLSSDFRKLIKGSKIEDFLVFQEGLLGKWFKCLPKIKVNAFIQYKRPVYISRSNGAESGAWSYEPYYRYKIMPCQQRALSELEQNMSGQGVVVYACPAFHMNSELLDAVNSGKIIDRSHFCQAGQLNQKSGKPHAVMTFQEPLDDGWAFSDPEKIEGYDFLSHLNELRGAARPKSNVEYIHDLAGAVQSAMSGDSVNEQELPADFMEERWPIAESALPEGAETPLVNSIARIFAFILYSKTNLLLGY